MLCIYNWTHETTNGTKGIHKSMGNSNNFIFIILTKNAVLTPPPGHVLDMTHNSMNPNIQLPSFYVKIVSSNSVSIYCHLSTFPRALVSPISAMFISIYAIAHPCQNIRHWLVLASNWDLRQYTPLELASQETSINKGPKYHRTVL